MNWLVARAAMAVTTRYGIWASRRARTWKGDPSAVNLINLRDIERRVRQGEKAPLEEVQAAAEWADKNGVKHNLSYHLY